MRRRAVHRVAAATGHTGRVDRREVGARIAAHIDRHHPRLGSALLKLRWGGLRTVQPGGGLWAGIGAVGLGMGLASRSVLGRRGDGSHRLPALPSMFAGMLSVWLGLWRLDSVRWRRSHVTLVLDLPQDLLDATIEHLRDQGLSVQPHHGRPTVAGTPSGLTCRLRDLRRVNAVLDGLDLPGSDRAHLLARSGA